MRQKIDVKGPLVGKRLDLAIVAADLGLSRRKVRKIIDLGGSYINRRRVRIASRTVGFGDVIELDYQEAALVQRIEAPTLLEADLLFENDRYVAISKPAGLVSQPTRQQAVSHVLKSVTELMKSLGRNPGQLQLVHRLDKETSGVMILAKSQASMEDLSQQFRDRTVKKIYHALCQGRLDGAKQVSCLLSRIHPSKGRVRIEQQSGKPSYTEFMPLDYFDKERLTLVACYPKTGRSHQIRVHLESLGHPILGDKIYGRSLGGSQDSALAELVAKRHYLHAAEIEFKDRGQLIRVTAPYPSEMRELLVGLAL